MTDYFLLVLTELRCDLLSAIDTGHANRDACLRLCRCRLALDYLRDRASRQGR